MPFEAAYIEARLRRAQEDLAKLKSGWKPTAKDLAEAPLLEGWYRSTRGEHDEFDCLCGTAIGHPRLGTQPITTAPLIWLDPSGRFARTEGRFYRLGRPLGWKSELTAEIASVDTEAERIGYVDPPAELVPTGRMGEDPTWVELAVWYRAQNINFDAAIRVYISRRFDEPPSMAYAMTDSWAKGMWKKFDREDEAAERAAAEEEAGFKPR